VKTGDKAVPSLNLDPLGNIKVYPDSQNPTIHKRHVSEMHNNHPIIKEVSQLETQSDRVSKMMSRASAKTPVISETTDKVYASILKSRANSRINGEDKCTPLDWDGFSDFSQNLTNFDVNCIKQDHYRVKIPKDVLQRLQRRPGFVTTSPGGNRHPNPRLYMRDNKLYNKINIISNGLIQQDNETSSPSDFKYSPKALIEKRKEQYFERDT